MFTPSDVRQGNFAGMLVNAVTKNGTNEFHGGASYTYRSNQDVAGFDLVGQDLRASKFDFKQYGFYVGGPIIRDRLHFFVAPEFQHRTQPAAGPYYLNGQGFNSPAVELDSLTRIATFMKTNYGFDVGSTGPVDIDNPLTNLFGRVDFQISPTHRLVVREIINHNDLDAFSRNMGDYQTAPSSFHRTTCSSRRSSRPWTTSRSRRALTRSRWAAASTTRTSSTTSRRGLSASITSRRSRPSRPVRRTATSSATQTAGGTRTSRQTSTCRSTACMRRTSGR